MGQFIGFAYTGTPANKAKIKRYWDEIEPILRTSHGVYKGRSKKNLGVAAEAVGLSPGLQWKAIPFVNNGDDNVRLIVKNGHVHKKDPYAIEHIIPFNQRRLAKEGADYVASKVKRFDDEANFTVNNGPYTMDGYPQDKEDIGLFVEKLMLEYTKENKHHYWKQWLHGVTYYEPTNQVSPRQYLKRRHNKRKTKQFKQSRREQRKEWFAKHGL